MEYNLFVDIKNSLEFSRHSRVGIDENDNMDAIVDKIEDAVGLEPVDNYWTRTGASKCVIICPDYDKVLKIPYNGYYESDGHNYDCDCEDSSYRTNCNGECDNCQYSCEVDYEDTLVWEHFCGADTDEDWNYCEVELDKYIKACEDGFGVFLAAVEYFGETKNGYPLYLQEKVPNIGGDDDVSHKPSEKSMSRAAEINSKDIVCTSGTYHMSKTNFSTNWLAAAIEHYGEKLTIDFIQYAQDNDLDVDMHSENYGYRKDGSPVILDYSGFNS